jgi:hypothetical protein
MLSSLGNVESPELASQACVAQVEREELLVGDFGGFLVEWRSRDWQLFALVMG